jgi:2-polyprenyl-3-methyl-5-hydroxy-6-metoxy-1,4-benzoquinol methylase
MDLIISVKPFSVLDVGSGFGKYGVLCREYLELWDGRYEYEFLRRIDGVEVFENYITPLHKYIYNNIYTENIINLVNNLDYSYDLVLLIDVLEHFSKEEGISLLNNLLKKNKGVLVSTPKSLVRNKMYLVMLLRYINHCGKKRSYRHWENIILLEIIYRI